MTVGELRDLLDDFGDHLPVKLDIAEPGASNPKYSEPDVHDLTIDGEITVVLQAT